MTNTQPNSDKLKSRKTQNPVQTLAALAIEAILSKKGTDLVIMDMRTVSGIADLFILCTGASDLQIKAIVDAVKMEIKTNADERPWHIEGYESRQWVLLDYVDLVVHVFNPEKRAFYDLERLWGDAPKEEVSEDALIESLKLLNT